MRSSVVYGSWDVTSGDVMPERTYLYYVQPIGLGSAYVESLTGYIARLAEGHNVSTGTLLTRELLPSIRMESRQGIYAARAYSTAVYELRVLNGVGECSRNWIQLLQRLTGISSLESLTLLTWSRIIANRSLLRNNRAWCPYCYDDWRCSERPIYESLLWSIHAVSHCPLHRRPLADHCPHCKQMLHPLSAASRPGHCCRCRGWLGQKSVEFDATKATDAGGLAAAGIGELLSAASNLAEPPSPEHFKQNFQRCIDDSAVGSRSTFCRAIGVSFDQVSHWLSANGRIRLDLLVQVCSQFGISPLQFLTEQIPASSLTVARKIVRQRNLQIESWPRKGSPNPVSVSSTAQRRDSGKKQGAEELNSLLAAALRETPAPTRKEFAERLGWTVCILQYRFPRACAELVARLPERKLLFKAKLRATLSAALTEEPAPSMKTVAQRVERSAAHLRAIYRDLCREITKRYLWQKDSEASRRRLEFQAQIHCAVIDLAEHGINPSRTRVFASIPNPTMRSTRILDRQIATTRLELLENHNQPQPQDHQSQSRIHRPVIAFAVLSAISKHFPPSLSATFPARSNPSHVISCRTKLQRSALLVRNHPMAMRTRKHDLAENGHRMGKRTQPHAEVSADRIPG